MKAGGRIGSRIKTATIILGLLILNMALVFPRFTGEYTQYLGSIESAFLSDARFIVQRYPHLSWNPLWYMGYPFHIFYTPLLPCLMAAINSLIPTISTPAAYRLITSFLYALGPVTLYLFLRYLTKRQFTAVLAGFSYSLLPSFCYLIGEVRGVASGFGYSPWRLIALLLYGEGPHISALAFTPLAAWLFLRGLKEPCLANYLLAALAISLVALLNWIALFALAVILGVILLSEMLLGDPRRKGRTALLCGLLAYGLSAFWFNVSFLQASLAFGQGGGLLRQYLFLPFPLLILGLILAAVVFLFFAGNQERQPTFIGLAWLGTLAFIVFGWYGWRWVLSPQPNRYMPEMNMGATIVGALIVTGIYDRLREWESSPIPVLRGGFSLLLGGSIILCSLPFLKASSWITKPQQDISRTSEYRVAQWLAAHVEEGERAYATGSHGFWLNVFSDVPQIRGGSDQGAIHPWWKEVTYQINTGEEAEISILWAKALNIRYIVVSYPGSADAYQDYRYPGKFEGKLAKRYDNDGIAIFEVPLERPELAVAVDKARYPALPSLQDVLDGEGLKGYVQLIEGSTPADYRIINNDQLQIDNREDKAILVKMTYHKGWTATCEGRELPIERGPVGFMLIENEGAAPCTIELRHGRVWDEWLGYGVTGATLLALMGYGLSNLLRRRMTDER